MDPVIDIVMPVWNQRSYTEACINSLYRYTDPNLFHLIVVDNGSTDGVREYLRDTSVKVKNMTLILSDENLGWCKGLNRGFKELSKSCQYVLWANNDILFEPEWLQRMLNKFKGWVGAVGPTSNYVAGRQSIKFNRGHEVEEVPLLIGFCLIFRREVINLVGDVDERYQLGGAEEYDYLIRMKKELGFKCVIARDVYIHHFGSKSIMSLPAIEGSQEKYLDYCKDHDVILDDKWGKDEVNKYLGEPLRQLLIAVPHPGYILPGFWRDTLMMARHPTTEIVDLERPSDIEDARNTLIKFGRNGGFRRILFADSDMRIPVNAIYKLNDIDAKIKSGYFFARNAPHYPCAFKFTKDNEYVSMWEPNTGVKEVDGMGMAFTMIDLDIFDNLKEPWFEKGKYGEDLGFCHKVRMELGIKMFVDTDLIIRHIGERREIGPEDYKPEEMVAKA